MISIKELAKKLNIDKTFALFCHVRPDGDTVGSAIGLKLALEAINKTVDVFCDDDIPEKFSFIEATKTISKKLDKEYDCYVAIDCSEPFRLGYLEPIFMSKKNTFCIDHHFSNSHFTENNYVVDNSSNAENIYALITEMQIPITTAIAEALLMGVCTDTGCFCHKNTNANTLDVASRLVQNGADLNKISYLMFKKQPKERAKLYGLVMSKIRYFNNERIGIITISQEDLLKANASADLTEGFIDFILNIDCVEIAVCLLEVKEKSYKISFRSKGADVNAVAGTFGGGGHILASGCMINGYYEDVIDKLVYACKQNMTD